MIAKNEVPPRAPRPLRVALLGVALAAFVLFPTFVSGDAVSAQSDDAEEIAAAELREAYHTKMLQLRREGLELEHRLHEMHLEQMEVEREIEEALWQHERDLALREIEELEKEGSGEEADLRRRELELHERRMEHELRHAGLEREMMRKRAEIDFELRRLELEHEEHLARGLSMAPEFEKRAHDLQTELEKLNLEELEAQIQRRMEEFEQQLQRLHELKSK
jgi:hypothetical protein